MGTELLPTLLGALPDLGAAGIVLIVLTVAKRLVDSERVYFREERAAIRAEAAADRTALRAELTEAKAEIRELELRLDMAWQRTSSTEPRHRLGSPD